jgi:hypothetical protein
MEANSQKVIFKTFFVTVEIQKKIHFAMVVNQLVREISLQGEGDGTACAVANQL